MQQHRPKRFHKTARVTTGQARNGSAASRGYTYHWQKVSKTYRISHPYCEVMHCFTCNLIWKKGAAPARCPKCGAETRVCGKPAKCVDHIKPVSGPDDPLFYEPSNHESCCFTDHSRLTVLEDGGFGRRRRKG